MSVRYMRAFARGAMLAVLATLPCAAGDLSPRPSAIAIVVTPQDTVFGFAETAARSPEPFDGFATEIAQGSLLHKWNAAQTELRIDIDIISACRAEPDTCESISARRIIAIVTEARQRTGRAAIGEINRAVNLAIAPASDVAQYGIEDRWASPLTTFASGRGDCEDYAIAKYALLRAAGFGEDELRLLIVQLPQSKADHAVLSVRHDGRWLVLDNRRFAMLDVAHLDAVPLYALKQNDRRPDAVAEQEQKMDKTLAFAGSEIARAPDLM